MVRDRSQRQPVRAGAANPPSVLCSSSPTVVGISDPKASERPQSRRPTAFSALTGLWIGLVWAMVCCPLASAETPSIFGPAQFVRGTGAPQEFGRTFENCAPSAHYKLVVLNGNPDGTHRIRSASIFLDGVRIVSSRDFRASESSDRKNSEGRDEVAAQRDTAEWKDGDEEQNEAIEKRGGERLIARIEKSISVLAVNQLRIRIAGKPGGFLTISVECSSQCPSKPLATSDGSNITFTTASCQIISSILLINQQVVTAQGTTTVIRDRVNISDDGTHAGVYTITFASDPADGATEAVVTGTFRYFDSSGQLWQIVAPRGTDFFLPIDKSQRLLTSDGSRILMINSNEGNTDPVFTVYDEIGSVLYQSSGTFLELYEAQISPNGRYLLVMGIVKRNGTYGALIRVTDISTKLSSDLPLDIVKGGRPFISISSDGRFLISSQGIQVVLP